MATTTLDAWSCPSVVVTVRPDRVAVIDVQFSLTTAYRPAKAGCEDVEFSSVDRATRKAEVSLEGDQVVDRLSVRAIETDHHRPWSCVGERSADRGAELSEERVPRIPSYDVGRRRIGLSESGLGDTAEHAASNE